MLSGGKINSISTEPPAPQSGQRSMSTRASLVLKRSENNGHLSIIGFCDYAVVNSLGKLPLFGVLFRENADYNVRRGDTGSILPTVRGIFSVWNIYDSVTLSWLRYLTDEDCQCNIPHQIEVEQQSVGLISALLLTVWVAFVLLSSSDKQLYSTNLGALFICLWCAAFILMLSSTVLSVFMVLAISKTASIQETVHFYNILKERTLGFGTASSFALFYCSAVCAVSGMACYLFLMLELIPAVMTLVITFFCCCLFFIFYYFMVSSLHSARMFSKQVVSTLPEVLGDIISCREKYITTTLVEFADNNGGVEFLPQEEEFRKFLLASVLEDLGLDNCNDAGGASTDDAERSPLKFSLSRLTDKRVVYVYDKYLRDHVE